MKRHWSIIIALFFVLDLLIASCTGAHGTTSSQGSAVTTGTLLPQSPEILTLWVDSGVLDDVKMNLANQDGFRLIDNKDQANLLLQVKSSGETVTNLIGKSQWVYALVAPFPTVTDGINIDGLKNLWIGNVVSDLPLDSIQVNQATRKVFDSLWGASSANNVITVTDAQLQGNDFTQLRNWAIVPFEQINPRWKVIKIGGLSPLDKPLNVDHYGLTVNFVLTSVNETQASSNSAQKVLALLPATNRDEAKMTVLMMTGTTALTRAIAYKMEIKGLDYPIEMVKPWFENADLIHVSNEVSFNPDCPYPNAYQQGLQFCANPRYLQTLKDLGVNVVELTGNHENDYGPEYFVNTIQTYKDLGWTIFGGGNAPDEARQPATVEVNGNKIAFIGCNPEGPTSDWVTEDRAGVANCDDAYFAGQISQLKSQGYVVVATFQHYEVYTYMYGDVIASDFRNAALAGADIVSGSQSHYAMGFQFVGNSLIHFGLGNFLFDQMSYEGVGDNIRREFIDRHIIYNGKYINTELLTAYLMDWAQPNPMDQQKREDFLTEIFHASKLK